MKNKISLSTRLTASFLGFSLIPLLCFFLIFFPYLSNIMMDSRMTNLEGLATANVSDLEEMGSTLFREGERLAMDQRVLTLLGVFPAEDQIANQLSVNTYLQTMLDDTCYAAAIMGVDGQVKAQIPYETYNSGTASEIDGVLAALQGTPSVSGLLPSRALPGSSAIYFAVPIVYGEEVKGALLREMAPAFLAKKTESIEFGETGKAMLIDGEGMILSHSDASRIGQMVPSDVIYDLFVNYRAGRQERSGYGITNMDGVAQCYGYRMVSNMPWMLVIYQTESEARSPEVLIMLYAALAILGLTLLCFIISRIVAKSSLAPIKRINHAFKQTAYNQFIPVTPTGASEFVELSEGFNSMIDLIGKNITQLSDSNKQLSTTIAELEIERDRMQFLRDMPGDGTAQGTAEFNLLSGELLADDNFYTMLGMEHVSNLPLKEFLASHLGQDDINKLYEMLNKQPDQIHTELKVQTTKGIIWVQVHARIFYNVQGDLMKVSATLLDTTQIQDSEIDKSPVDSATGLSTRLPFLKELENRVDQDGTVIYINLEGIPEGEQKQGVRSVIYRITADRLRSFVAPDGMAARIGQSTFALQLYAASGQEPLENKMAELIQVVTAPIPWQQETVTLKMEAGAALYTDDRPSPEALLHNAKAALAAAQALPEALWTLYDEEMQAENAGTDAVALESTIRAGRILEALRTAVEDGSLTLEYQPTINLKTNEVAGFETTVRLHVPEIGVVSAGELIPLAEQHSLMLPVGTWILQESCRYIKTLRTRQNAPLFVSVNISASQLEDAGFIDAVYLALKEAGLPGNALQIEFSESRLFDMFVEKVEAIRTIRSLGVRIALDDYGAGTSALSHLYNMPLDVLKIDRGFLIGAAASIGKEFILQTLVNVAHNLNFDVIAVGVEHHNRLDTLMKLGYDMAQGYHFCPPLPPAALEVYLDTRVAHKQAE